MLNYYEFNQMPFEKAIFPQSLYMTSNHEEAVSRMEYAIQGNRFAVLTGACVKIGLNQEKPYK